MYTPTTGAVSGPIMRQRTMANTEHRQREPQFWSVGDSERLRWTNIDDAIVEWIDDMYDATLPDEITVIGYAPMEVSTHHLNPLEHVLEYLDEEYGDPDGAGWSKPTERMKEAERGFLRVVKEEYVSWSCEEVARKTINVREWRREYGYDNAE
jgi:hypothetical protein